MEQVKSSIRKLKSLNCFVLKHILLIPFRFLLLIFFAQREMQKLQLLVKIRKFEKRQQKELVKFYKNLEKHKGGKVK